MFFTILMSRLIIGQSKVGDTMNYFIFTRLTMLEMQDASCSIGMFSESISDKRVFRPKADW